MSAMNKAPAPYTDAPIRVGHSVYTLDNKRLGQVKEIGETHFKVDARFRRDFWLAASQVAYVDDRCVGMLFRSDEAELYKLQRAVDDVTFPPRSARGPRPGDGASDANWRNEYPLT